jgi:hypothetical protein
MQRIDPTKYVSILNAARLMGLSRQHVHNLLDSGRIRGCQIEQYRFVLKADCSTYTRTAGAGGRPRQKPADGRD